MRLLVLGHQGQLATHLRQQHPGAWFWGRDTLDLNDLPGVRRRVVEAAPQVIINAAAFTAVDGAEQARDAAWTLNCEAPAALARAATQLQIPLIHFSTEYVFDGEADRPYTPEAPAGPLNVYGASKLAGELAVRNLCERHWILRTSWVFSEHGSNFVKTMLKLATQRDELSVVDDQVGRPNYAADLARLAIRLAESTTTAAAPAPGIYHLGNGPALSWCEFARTIFSQAHAMGLLKRQPRVAAIRTAEFPTPARRPLRAVLAPSETFQTSLGGMPEWPDSLDEALRHLGGMTADGA